MSDISVANAGVDTRQSMIRVWMALSAVWVAFWLLIAGIVWLTVGTRYPFTDELAAFSLIVLIPPIALLGIGALARWTFEMLSRIPDGDVERAVNTSSVSEHA